MGHTPGHRGPEGKIIHVEVVIQQVAPVCEHFLRTPVRKGQRYRDGIWGNVWTVLGDLERCVLANSSHAEGRRDEEANHNVHQLSNLPQVCPPAELSSGLVCFQACDSGMVVPRLGELSVRRFVVSNFLNSNDRAFLVLRGRDLKEIK